MPCAGRSAAPFPSGGVPNGFFIHTLRKLIFINEFSVTSEAADDAFWRFGTSSARTFASQELVETGSGGRGVSKTAHAVNGMEGPIKMEEIGMKTATIVAVAFATLMSIPLLAQQVDAPGNQNAAATAGGARGAAGFGDEAASHEWEMSSASGELQGKLDSKTAKVGDRVVLKTTEKVQTSDGTVIPKGSRLVGHVTQVQAHDEEHATAQMAIVFDRVELKDGQSVAIYTLLRGVSPSASAMAMSSANSGDSFGAPMGGGGMAGGGQAMGGGRAGGGLVGGTGRTVSDTGGLAGGTLDRTAATTSSVGENAGAGLDQATDSAVQTAGHGDLNLSSGAHAQAAARAVPHATGIPGIMLAGSSSASGVFSASRKNIEFESGTQMQLGIVADW